MVTISASVISPDEKMRYLYETRQILIVKLNSLSDGSASGGRAYQTFLKEKYRPIRTRIHAEMSRLRKEGVRLGVAPNIVDTTDVTNNDAMEAYRAEKESLKSATTYRTDILRDNPDLRD